MLRTAGQDEGKNLPPAAALRATTARTTLTVAWRRGPTARMKNASQVAGSMKSDAAMRGSHDIFEPRNWEMLPKTQILDSTHRNDVCGTRNC